MHDLIRTFIERGDLAHLALLLWAALGHRAALSRAARAVAAIAPLRRFRARACALQRNTSQEELEADADGQSAPRAALDPGETKARPDHLTVFREFLGHLDRIGRRAAKRPPAQGEGEAQAERTTAARELARSVFTLSLCGEGRREAPGWGSCSGPHSDSTPNPSPQGGGEHTELCCTAAPVTPRRPARRIHACSLSHEQLALQVFRPRTRIEEDGTVEGYASLFGEIDAARDMVMPGRSRARSRAAASAACRCCSSTTRPSRSACGSSFTRTSRGLRARGRLIPDVARARELIALVRAGAVDGLSIGFRTVKGRVDPASRVRRLIDVDLWEISIVTFPLLAGARVRAQELGLLPAEPRAGARRAGVDEGGGGDRLNRRAGKGAQRRARRALYGGHASLCPPYNYPRAFACPPSIPPRSRHAANNGRVPTHTASPRRARPRQRCPAGSTLRQRACG